jgi:hypothetical protein
MDALSRHLEGARDPDKWLSTLDLRERPEANLWLNAVQAICLEAEDLLDGLRKAMIDPPVDSEADAAAWQTYFRTQSRSDEIFRECLALLGGLALRDRITDEFVCRFADELIRECAEFVGKPRSFAIPAYEDTLSSTLRRVARVGFPDWHLWTLPLVAHEYSEVVLRETSLRRLVEELASADIQPLVQKLLGALNEAISNINNDAVRDMTRELLAQAIDPELELGKLEGLASNLLILNEAAVAGLTNASVDSIRDALEDAIGRVQVLVADAFATFTTGPAYACAALFLRLNPISPRRAGRPADTERAETILATLRAMNDGAAPPPFVQVTDVLDESWHLLLASTGGTGDGLGGTPIGIDTARVLPRIKGRILKPEDAAYTSENWLNARGLGETWWNSIGNTTLEPAPDTPPQTLRDILNAAWWSRVLIMQNSAPDVVEKYILRITDVARKSCEIIVARRSERGDSPAFIRPSSRPR